MAEDSVDLETITGLEARITAALERISAAAAATAIGGRDSAAEARAAVEAERAEAAENARRIGALEAELAEAQAAREMLEAR
ncbi:Uma2 family endonuclease, partial [Rhodobacterales bacterium HKCCE2091]|nr:Uma2 family endonuclease [Rhodobacterales bacterium HKCCE2091]